MSKNPELDSAQLPDVLPVLPLKDVVVFPYVIVPLSVASEASLRAVDRALATNRIVMLVNQVDADSDDPSPDELTTIGTAAMIMRMLKLPDGRIRILVQGISRAQIQRFSQHRPFLKARIERLGENTDDQTTSGPQLQQTALVRNLRENLEHILSLGKSLSPEVMVVAANLDDPGRLADLTASNLDLSRSEAQSLLETIDPLQRLESVGEFLRREVELLSMQHAISNQAKHEIDRSQREYFLRQQIKAIQDELGEGDEFSAEIEAFRRIARAKEIPAEANEELERQIRRLERSHPESAEHSVIRTYLDWLTGLPWGEVSRDHLDLENARRILERDHFDLEKVKERIIEYLAVRKLNPDARGPILCFVGPPGVGKTSLGRSIAAALGRRFTRVSLGGVRDEAEIRGHRRTYVGALSGRILQGLHQAGTSNPVFMLDEIDKIGADVRGDPSSALLEVLDPEQNCSFRDHYLGVPYDLSRVIFITTANLLETVQPAFVDRMEVIRLSGYTQSEKLQIARQHLLPKLRPAHGISGKNIRFTDAGLLEIIRSYTREAGLRNLERELAAVCRKTAVRVALGESSTMTVTPTVVEQLLGPKRHFAENAQVHDRVGVATGLAWTATGGDLLIIEVLAVPGKGKLSMTGRLGEVMRESAQIALSCARAHAATLPPEKGRGPSFFAENDIHIHAPAGSIPKDGPSAGVTIAIALVSMLLEQPVRRSVAMTGEITLRGEVLAIGGLKEKVLAARTAGLDHVILPRANEHELKELPRELREGAQFSTVERIEEALAIALRASD